MEVVRGLSVRIAATGHLMALKLLSVGPGRETDAADLRALAKVATPAEWDRACVAVGLIEQRGFQRGRSLIADLADLRLSSEA
jgi:hypothetical protein